MLKLIAMLPEWALWALLATVAAVLVGIGASGAWYARGVIADRDVGIVRAELAALKLKHAEEKTLQADADRIAEVEARQIEARRTHRIQEIADAERLKAAPKRRALAAAVAADADSLRDTAADYERAHCAAPDPATAGGSPAASGSGLVLSNVLGSCAARLADLARWAEDAHAVGLVCERSYEALTDPPAAPQDTAAPEP